ncbi:anti-sigma factor [Streptomyces sp. NPDC020875]|uniref:anti-sigma factor n=1 Tax=Streptomyces sp. NPDC020875 TaxID=3154898 RepID=UPI0033D2C8B7
MTNHPNDSHTLAAAYALGALDDPERGDFEAHSRTCEACRQEAAEFAATAARLAAAVSQTPPATAKAQVMAAIDGVRQVPPRIPASSTAPAIGALLRRRAVSLALAAVVAAVALGGVALWQTQNAQDLERQARQSRQQLDAITGILAAPDARTVHGKASNGALTTVVTSERQNRAAFTTTGLPAPGAGKTYQLWLDHDGTMRPAGLIDHDGTVILTGNPADAGAVGLSLEPTGGSPQPTTDPLLLMALPT